MDSSVDSSRRQLLDAVRSTPDVTTPSRYLALAHAIRRAVLRLTRHTREHDQQTLEMLVAYVDELTRREAAPDLAGEVRDALARRLVRDPAAVGVDVARWRNEVEQHLLSHGGWAPRLPDDIVEASTDAGSMLLPGYDRYITPPLQEQGRWEPEEAEFITSLLGPGMHVIDVGAHVGYHTLRAARAVGEKGRVISFEPSPANFALLCANIVRNQLTNALPFNVALGAETGIVDLTLSLDNTGGNRAYALDYVEPDFQIPCVALDEILPPDAEFDLVKIDIEGMDHRAVEGMANMLRRSRPWVLAEFNPELIAYLGSDAESVVRFYRDLGYKVRVLEVPELLPDAPARDYVDRAVNAVGGYVTLVLQPEST